MAKKRKAKKSKVKRTKAKKTKLKRKSPGKKNKPERHPNDVGTPEPTVTDVPPIPTGFGPNSATTLEPNDARRASYCMNPKLIIDHLAQAEVHVAQGVNHVKWQRQLLEDLTRDGHDTTGSSALLDLFKELQNLHVQDRDRLRAELAATRKN